MKMSDLYEEMKAALAYFDLSFHEMDKVKATIMNNSIVFSFGSKTISIQIESE